MVVVVKVVSLWLVSERQTGQTVVVEGKQIKLLLEEKKGIKKITVGGQDGLSLQGADLGVDAVHLGQVGLLTTKRSLLQPSLLPVSLGSVLGELGGRRLALALRAALLEAALDLREEGVEV